MISFHGFIRIQCEHKTFIPNGIIQSISTFYPVLASTFYFSEENKKAIKAASTKKEAAKKELQNLKEYLELGVITQEEYDEKLQKLRKIILSD